MVMYRKEEIIMQKFVAPELDKNAFTCPCCGVLAGIEWDHTFLQKISNKFIFTPRRDTIHDKLLYASCCHACGNLNLWQDGKIIEPITSGVPNPNDDMPDNVKITYNEARAVFPYSTKAAAALLRLAVQLLCEELGGEGKNINEDIGKLVRKGLSVRIQKALDAIRVIGNNAVHPGTIDLDDNKETAGLLFGLLNIIVNEMITQPKEIDEIYTSLPQGAIDAIVRRDNVNSGE